MKVSFSALVKSGLLKVTEHPETLVSPRANKVTGVSILRPHSRLALLLLLPGLIGRLGPMTSRSSSSLTPSPEVSFMLPSDCERVHER